jgi:1-acyl-sn-glycerol-3-phosphate acyltransferase
MAPGAKPAYKYGIVHMYDQIGITCVPMALNSGVFWPRRKFLRHPGTIVVEVLPPIPPGLSREAFFGTMTSVIEAASDRLLSEARATSRP